MTRRRWMGLATAGAAGAYPLFIEPRWFDVTEKRVPVPGLQQRIRLVHLSDLHYGFRVPLSLLHRAIDHTIGAKPDLVCLTGDYVTNNWTDDPIMLVDALERLPKAVPTFAVLGNHDVDPVGELLISSGIKLLDNAWEVMSIGAQRLAVVGLGDLWSTGLVIGAAFDQCPVGVPRVVLCHNPDSKDYLHDAAFDLMLSGHTHGGQIVIPFFGPRAWSVRDQTMLSGLHRWNGRWIHVTRGVGSLFGVRFNCRPEISILDLEKA